MNNIRYYAYFDDQPGLCRDITGQARTELPEFLMLDGKRYRLHTIEKKGDRLNRHYETRLHYTPAPAEDYGA